MQFCTQSLKNQNTKCKNLIQIEIVFYAYGIIPYDCINFLTFLFLAFISFAQKMRLLQKCCCAVEDLCVGILRNSCDRLSSLLMEN